MYMDFWGRCRHVKPAQPSGDAASGSSEHRSGIFVAFSILMCIQFAAVCMVVAIRRRALQRHQELQGVAVHRTRDGWLTVNDSDDEGADHADNQVGLPSYDEIAREDVDGPPSYDAVHCQGPPPPPMSPRESTTSDVPAASATAATPAPSYAQPSIN